MKKEEKKELTFTFLNAPSKEAKEFHARFMYQKYLEGRFSQKQKCEREVS